MTKTRLALRAAAVWGVLVALLAIGAALPGRKLPAIDRLDRVPPGLLPAPKTFDRTAHDQLVRADGALLVGEVLPRDGRGIGETLTATHGRPTRTAGGVDVAGRSGVLHVYDPSSERLNTRGWSGGLIVAGGPLDDDLVLAVMMITPGPPTELDQRLLLQVAAEVRPLP